jgi:Na+-translocating ferredoxin:NAD+ oxidoreductase RNF subunit RnfB
VRREKPFTARAGLRLDEDMAKAIAKLSEIEKLRRMLPGRDCALCGAPTCDALAEDVALGRSCSISDCRFPIAE